MTNKNLVLEIAQALSDINYLSSVQYDENTIANYARIIVKHNPKVKVMDIKNLMDNFFKGNAEFSPNMGVRNFTKPLYSSSSKKRNEL